MDSNIEVYGATWCPATNRMRAFMDSNGLEYTFIDAEEDLQAQAHVAAWNGGRPKYPTLVLQDGTKLFDPTEAELLHAAERAGMGAGRA